MPEELLPGHAPATPGAETRRAPESDIGSFAKERYVYQDVSHDTYRKGTGPAVLVMTEMPGISPQVLGFADRVVSLGCTAVLPDQCRLVSPAVVRRSDVCGALATAVRIFPARSFVTSPRAYFALAHIGGMVWHPNGVSRNIPDRLLIKFENGKERRFDLEWVTTH